MRVLAVVSYSDRAEAAMFIGLSREGIDLEVLCEPSASAFEVYRAAGIAVEALSIRRHYELSAIRRIRARLRTGGFDVLHLLTRRAVRNGIVAARGSSVRIVAYRGVAGGTRLYDPASWLTYLNPAVDRIVCVSDVVRNDLLDQRLLGVRVPPQKAITISKGHDVDWYSAPPADLAELGVPPGGFTVGCMANLRANKAVDRLVASARHLPPDNGVRFVLVGRDMDGARVRRWIDTTPDPGQFHVMGHRRDGPEIMAACDALVLPSIGGEGLSKVVIEAMAHGTPPIVTVPGGGELVEDGRSGLVVPPDDPVAIAAAITRLANDRAGAEQMGRAARERIREHFSVGETVRRTRRLYEELSSTS
ncbi:MAG: glycosyltransferase family 4 protein [Gemmatimonadota bacterium]